MSSGPSADGRSGFGPGVVFGVLIGLAVALLAGYLTGTFDDDSSDPVVEARQTIEDSYFKASDTTELNDDSISGMVDALKKKFDDKFSHYFTPDQYAEFNAATSGHFSGVGLTVTEVPKGLRVVSVLPDTPADKAGLEEGDVITEVEGKSIAGVASDVSTAEIKGPAGTQVTITIAPADGGKPHEVTLERADVRVPAVRGAIRRGPDGEKLAYVRFFTFSEGASDELRAEVERLYRKGAEGLVLDLRDNGGGLLNEAVLSTSIFLDHGNVVSTRSRTQGDQDYPATGDAIDPRPTAVLVDRGTASAAEILTAALQQNDLARVVGTRTYGKGTFQEILKQSSGGALDLTIGEYLTSDGTSILGEGVKPNVRVEDDRATENRDEALDEALDVVGAEVASGRS